MDLIVVTNNMFALLFWGLDSISILSCNVIHLSKWVLIIFDDKLFDVMLHITSPLELE